MGRLGVLAVLASLTLAACGGSGGSSTGSTTSSTSSTTSTTAEANSSARLAATFTVRAGGRLFPPKVAAPTHTKIVLSVRAGDSRRHLVTVATPHPHQAEVALGRPAKLTLNGVADGTYEIKVDGAARGRLIVGATPGP